MYGPIEHPRWGAIMGVIATKDILDEQEVLTYYGYREGNPIPGDYPWYWKQKEQIEADKLSQSIAESTS